jgi:hypothetical protein
MRPAIMKFFAFFALMSLGAATAVQKDRTITQVVKLLQDMLEKSKKEGDAERVLYAKFKCYCDQSEAEKKASIEKLTEQIELLESSIAEVQGSTGGLSSECADLKTKMADNKAARDEAETIRGKEKKAFEAEEADLKGAIAQMKDAIETLSAVGADQTKSTGADNQQFMAKGASLLDLQAQVQSALHLASGLMNPTQQSKTAAFLQAPFTGTYSSQSAQVLGIIKSMRDTFKANLADARETEKNAIAAYKKFMKIKKEAYDEMSASYDEKQKGLGGNDNDLASMKKQLSEAKKQKASDEEFLDELLPLCETKAKGYENRKLLRANEEAAIAEAISILNSDDAFATFGGVDATSSGSTKFIQLRSVRRHQENNVRTMAQTVLEQASKEVKSTRITKVLAKLQAENPFDTVLDEIDKMIELIAEEGASDKENLDWCKKERKDNNADLKQKKKEILGLEKENDRLTKLIEDPKEGLKAQIADTEDSLVKNNEAQKTQTEKRLEENVAYQADVKNLVAAEGILTKAIKVLKIYYDDLANKLEAGEAAFVQEDPKPPKVFEDNSFEGQSSKGGDVIDMLSFIKSETIKEENEAHSDEEKAQADYEDSMTKLKKEQKEAEENLAGLQDKLAQAEKDLLDAQEDLKATTADKEAIEVYLLKIKPGCDFITKNFDTREKNRGIEKAALEKAVKLIKGTPAYKTAVNSATVESYGDCKEPCVEDEGHVKCKACMADVTIPAYCAGHKGTPGC